MSGKRLRVAVYPTNEQETVELFRLSQDRLGWKLVRLNAGYPDAIVRDPKGHELRAEFEYQARNFKQHGHDPAGCDVIICWRNNWAEAPLPMLVLEEHLPPVDPLWASFVNWQLGSVTPEQEPAPEEETDLHDEIKRELAQQNMEQTTQLWHAHAEIAQLWNSLYKRCQNEGRDAREIAFVSRITDLSDELGQAWRKIVYLQTVLRDLWDCVPPETRELVHDK